MTEPSDVTFVADALLEEGGRVDALLAAVVGILQATRNIPEVAIAVQQNLEMHHGAPLARSASPYYREKYESTRDYLLSRLRKR
jgi:DNA-binding phage protein